MENEIYEDLFSQRYHLRPSPDGLIDTNLSKSARTGICYVLEDYLENSSMVPLVNIICVSLRIPISQRNEYLQMDNDSLKSILNELILSAESWKVYDICEIVCKHVASYWGVDLHQRLTEELNTLFTVEHIGYEMRKGLLEKKGSAFIDAQIQQARFLLKEPVFIGADQQFEKAINSLNVRPQPDVENCIKDAVASIESVGRIISNDEKALLNNVIKDFSQKGIIPKPLDEALQKIYAYRGDAPGVAHGLVGESKVTIDEAELVLALSAAVIIYLVKKSKNDQQTI